MKEGARQRERAKQCKRDARRRERARAREGSTSSAKSQVCLLPACLPALVATWLCFVCFKMKVHPQPVLSRQPSLEWASGTPPRRARLCTTMHGGVPFLRFEHLLLTIHGQSNSRRFLTLPVPLEPISLPLRPFQLGCCGGLREEECRIFIFLGDYGWPTDSVASQGNEVVVGGWVLYTQR
jgi:hypothetical protein